MHDNGTRNITLSSPQTKLFPHFPISIEILECAVNSRFISSMALLASLPEVVWLIEGAGEVVGNVKRHESVVDAVTPKSTQFLAGSTSKKAFSSDGKLHV